MSRPIQAHIDLAALRHNFIVAQTHAGAASVWAVLKANAYGHGLARCASALVPCMRNNDGVALVEIEGAIALRESGIRHPILLLEGFYEPDEIPLMAEYQLIPTLHCLEQVHALIQAALPVKMPVHLKLNTGMNRLGLTQEEFMLALKLLKASRQISSITLMTHFSDADCASEDEGNIGHKGISLQMQRLHHLLQAAGDPALTLTLPLSLANSAALIRYPEIRGNSLYQARPGIMLYGGSPFPEQQTATALGLQPVMTLESELIATRHIVAGDRVGYSGAFTAHEPMRIGIVACGYADGYPRHAPTGTPVLVDGQRTRTLGRVSMDKLCIDLTTMPHATQGTRVVLWGKGLPADEVASAANTISYELFCALAARVPITVGSIEH